MKKQEELIKARKILSDVFNNSKEDWGNIWCSQLTQTIGSLDLTIKKLEDPGKWKKIRKQFEEKKKIKGIIYAPEILRLSRLKGDEEEIQELLGDEE